MPQKKRHTCVFCGKKRIETRMKRIDLRDPNEYLTNGSYWACFFIDWFHGSNDHYRAFLERKKGEYYLIGDKYASAIAKAGKVPRVDRD